MTRFVRYGVTTAYAFLASSVATAQSTADLSAQLLANTPSYLADEARRGNDGNGNPLSVGIEYRLADLDGSGELRFAVAAYYLDNDGTIRVFRIDGPSLIPVATLDQREKLGGSRIGIELVDLDADGVSEIVVSSYGAGVDYWLGLYRMNGNILESLAPAVDAVDAVTVDLDGDGRQELVVPQVSCAPDTQCRSLYSVFRLASQGYEFAFTTVSNPLGIVDANGNAELTIAKSAYLVPHEFSLRSIKRAFGGGGREEDREGRVVLRFGRLVNPFLRDAVPTVEMVDLASVRLASMRPVAVRLRRDDDRSDGDDSESRCSHFVEAVFPRAALLRLLPGIAPETSLRGATIPVEVSGRMQDGSLLAGSVDVFVGREDGLRSGDSHAHREPPSALHDPDSPSR